MKKITYSFPIVIIISVLIQAFGLVRSLVLSKEFGAVYSLDAFYLANAYTISIFSIVSSAVTTIAIPELNNDSPNRNRTLRRFLTIITMFSIIVSMALVAVIFVGRKIVANDFSSYAQTVFIVSLILLMISQQFRIQASFSIAALQNVGAYILPRVLDIVPAAIPVIYLLITPHPSIIILSAMTAIAYIAETLLFVLVQRKIDTGFAFRIDFGLDSELKRLLKAVVPILISSSVFQVQVLLSNNIAGRFGEGYITLLTNTNQVMGMFQSLIIVNMINMIYPKFVRDIKESIRNGLSKMTTYISVTNYLVTALIWAFFFTGEGLIQLMFVRGKFTMAEAHTVYIFSIVLAIALPISVIRDYCYRFYYSIGNTRKPMINSINTVAANVALLIIGYLLHWPVSIVLAPTIGSFFSCFSIIVKLYRDNVKIHIYKIFVRLIGANLIGGCAFAASSVLKVECANLFIQVCANGLLIIAIQTGIYSIFYFLTKHHNRINLTIH